LVAADSRSSSSSSSGSSSSGSSSKQLSEAEMLGRLKQACRDQQQLHMLSSITMHL
jgi:hypothetical protein